MNTTDIKIINQKILFQARKIRGYLEKQSNSIFVGFQKRFFLIIQDNLVYFIDQSLDQPKGYIQIINIKNLKAKGDCQFSFKHLDRVFYLKSNNTENRDEWVANLRILIHFSNLTNKKVVSTPIKWKKKQIELKLKSLAEIEMGNQNQKNEQKKKISDIQLIFERLRLYKLYDQFKEQKIKNRLIVKKFDEGYYFLISCKSLNQTFQDQQILGKQYIQPLDFNILYRYDQKQNQAKQIIMAYKISTLEMIDQKYLKINHFLLTYQNSINLFVQNIKSAITIGRQYHNQLKIPLKKNVQIILKIYSETNSDSAKQQKLRIKFQDQYLKIISKYERHYRKVHQILRQLLLQLLYEVKNFIGAFQVKKQFKQDIVLYYLDFMTQKIAQIIRIYWNENYQILTDEQILEISSWLHQYGEVIKKFRSNRFIMNGANKLGKIFFRNIYKNFQENINNRINEQKVFELSIAHCTKLPFEFSNIIEKVIKIILRNHHIEESTKKIEEYIIRCYGMLKVKLIDIINKQNKLDILIGFCNDLWIYKKQIQFIKQIKFDKINAINNQLHNLIGNKILKIIHIPFQILNSQPFFSLKIYDQAVKILKNIQSLQNLHYATIKLLKIKALQQLIGFYFKVLINNISAQNISYQNTIFKLDQDYKILSNLFTQYLQNNLKQKILKSFQSIKCLLKSQDNQQLSQIFITIKTDYLYKYISYRQVFIILGLRFLSEAKRKRILNICKQIYDNKIYQPVDIQLVMVQKNVQQINLTRKTTLTISFINQVYNNCILQGYLEQKNMYSIHKSYQKRYYKVMDGCINCYLTMASPQLINTIRILQMLKVYQHQKHPYKFFIQMPSDVIHKFKCMNSASAKHWVTQINKYKQQLIDQEVYSQQQADQIYQNTIIIDYFDPQHKKCYYDQIDYYIQRQQSIVSQQKIRSDSTKVDLFPKKIKLQKQSSNFDSPIKKDLKKKTSFWRTLTCIKTESEQY